MKGFKGGGGFKGFGGGGGFKGFKSSGSNFSSFRPSSGARPPSRGNHSLRRSNNNLGSFILGSMFHSAMTNNTNRTRTTSSISKNDVFPEVSPSNNTYTPTPRPPQYREYMKCEYCDMEYSDLSKTKCDACGAKLTRKKDTIGVTKSAATSVGTTPKRKAKALPIILTIVGVLVLIIIISTVAGGAKTVEGVVGVEMVTEYLSFTVNDAFVVTDASMYGLSENKYYIIVDIEIDNYHNLGPLPITSTDFALRKDDSFQYPLRNSGDERVLKFNIYQPDYNAYYFSLESGKSGYLVYEFNEYVSMYGMYLQYEEYDGDSDLRGVYLIDLNS